MIFLFQRYLPHYRVPVFKHLNDALNNTLVVCHGNPPGQTGFIFEEKLPFNNISIQNTYLKGETAVWQSFRLPFKIYGKPEALIIDSSPRILSLYPLWLYCQTKGIPFILWGHGGSQKRSIGESNHLKDFIHRFLIRHADAYICYTDGGRQELCRFADPQKIFVARNTLDTETLFPLRKNLEQQGKAKVKHDLGLHSAHYLCYIGRLIESKKLEYLLKIVAILQKQSHNIGAIIIGDGPEKIALEEYAEINNLQNIHFTGAISEWESSAAYLYAADIMVIPGYVGLSVNHAFCFGLPVITQASGSGGPIHSPEVEYIRSGETGFIVPHNDDSAMIQGILEILSKREFFYQKTVDFAETHLKIQNLVNGVCSAINSTRQSV